MNEGVKQREEVNAMHTAEYRRAKKEFVNCLCMGIIGLGVPFVLAFKEWWPIMQREKRKDALPASDESI